MFQVSVSVPDIAPSAKTAVRGVDKYWGYRLVSRAFVMVLPAAVACVLAQAGRSVVSHARPSRFLASI